MVTEESSVVAASTNAAKFWATRGGFHAEIVGTEKTVKFIFYLQDLIKAWRAFSTVKPTLLKETEAITKNMRQRGEVSLILNCSTVPKI